MAGSKTGKNIFRMNLECLVVLDSKEVLKHNKKSKIEKFHNGGGMSKGHSPTERLQMAQTEAI